MKLSTTNSLKLISTLLFVMDDTMTTNAQMIARTYHNNVEQFQVRRPLYYRYNPALDHVNWSDFTTDDFHNVLQCNSDTASSSTGKTSRPIHDAFTWIQLRQTYEDIVGPERSSITQVMNTIAEQQTQQRPQEVGNDQDDYEKNDAQQNFTTPDKKEMRPAGHAVPVKDDSILYADHIPGKGRGIRASRDIKAGERIWSEIYVATFYDRKVLNQFLAVLPTPLACDVILWTYYQNDDPYDEENFIFEVDLNVSTFCNNGGSSLANVRVEEGEFFNDFVADRDITAREEILCNYGEEPDYD